MQDPQQHELVIIRRRPDPEMEEVKGGVWKIAYADFMTAMMAFFLVMWLINVTDQETREVVADYFNPIRLAEATSDRRGLRDPDESSEGVDLEERSDTPVTEADTVVETAVTPPEHEPRYSEQALFQDPYAVLSELAALASFTPESPASGIDVTPGARGEPGLSGGDAYRDPFDPIYWQLAPHIAVGRSDGDGTGGPMGVPDALAPFGLGGPAGPADPDFAALAPSDEPSIAVEGAIALDGEPRVLAGAAAEVETDVAVDPDATEGDGDAAPVETAARAPSAAQAPDPGPTTIVAETEDEPVVVAETPPAPPAGAPEAAAVAVEPTVTTAAEVAETVPPADAQRAEGDFASRAEEQAAMRAAADETIADAETPEVAEASQVDPLLARAAALRALIAEAMEAATGVERPANAPTIEVTTTSEGVLVSLTDDVDFGMFAIGSAEPRPELVRVIEEIAPILSAEAGAIVIRGHTDARPFRSADYDNWRLSSARAHMAYYMLVRGGFAEERILRVEGHADRLLKVADDPLAAQNRRIEILLAGSEARS